MVLHKMSLSNMEDKLEIVNSGKSKKISNNSTNLNKALNTNNNVITFSKNGENHRVEVIIKDGKISYKHNNTTTKKTQTVDKASIETLMTGIATFNNYDRKVLNSNEFVNLLKGAYIDFNFAKIKELEAKGENVLNRIAPYVLLNKGVITVDGKVTETLIPKRLVDNKAQEVYIEMPRYGETNTQATAIYHFSDRGRLLFPHLFQLLKLSKLIEEYLIELLIEE